MQQSKNSPQPFLLLHQLSCCINLIGKHLLRQFAHIDGIFSYGLRVQETVVLGFKNVIENADLGSRPLRENSGFSRVITCGQNSVLHFKYCCSRSVLLFLVHLVEMAPNCMATFLSNV